MSEYLTVKQFAAAAGVSDKAIYQQMQGRLKEYVKKDGNTNTIDAAALYKFYYNKDEKENQVSSEKSSLEMSAAIEKIIQVSSQVSSLENEKLKAENELLKAALKDKDNNIVFLQQQINELQERLKEAHSTTVLQQQITAIEKKIEQEEEAAAVEVEPVKKHWWNRKK